jgi:LDH2 family malate/lactate/ureidoglycolate dehydrogenase
MSNSDPGMAPLGALGPVLGTNPLAIAAPPVAQVSTPSLDIASSTVAQGRIILASRAGTDIPPDWAIGPDGNPTQDPDEALKGAVLPMGGHKGFALAFMLDVLTGCLPGALLSPEIHGNPDAPTPQGTGHCFIAIHVASIRALPEYEESLRKLVDAVHSARRADWADQFMIPGEREDRATLDRSTGIPMTKSTVQLLCSLGEEYGVPYPG